MAFPYKVLAVNRSLITAVLALVRPLVLCQTVPKVPDCSTLKYSGHNVSCLCGRVDICVGDLCGAPQDYNLDDDITVELRDKSGTSVHTHILASECEGHWL